MKKLLFNPFEKYGIVLLLSMGLAFTLFGSFLATVFSARFDGVLDLHFHSGIPFWNPFIENAINIVVLAAALFIVARVINNKTRIIDILTAVILARLPLYLLTMLNWNNALGNASKKVLESVKDNSALNLPAFDLTLLVITGILTLVSLAWYIALLFNGFKVASNAKGTNHVILFAVSILVAEFISKLLIIQFL